MESGARGAAEHGKQFLFIAGITARSGTNFLARLLLAHPDVVRPRGFWELPLLTGADHFQAFYRAFVGGDGPGRVDYSFDEFARAFGDGFLTRVWDRTDAPSGVLLHKCPNTDGIEYFPLFFPTGRLIFLVRDGRDCVNSLLAASGYGTSGPNPRRTVALARLSNFWAKSARRILDCGGHARVVRYEDLHRSPSDTLRQIADFVPLRPDVAWLSAPDASEVRGSTHFDSSGDEEPGEARWESAPKTAKFQPVGRWQSSWSSVDRAIFAKLAGRELAALGYGDHGAHPA